MRSKIDLEKIPASHRRDVEKAVEILKKQGCREIYLFGSLAEGTVTPHSDIDLAAKGIPTGAFFTVYAELIKYLDHPVDLISLEKDNRFGNMLQKEGYLQRVS
jgi:predicted nucleotidyltransferase